MPELTIPAIVQILQGGVTTLKGEFIWGSNYTFLVEVGASREKLLAVYKPTQGERPLWDFPAASLARREAAAFIVSEALEWGLVPPTVYREEAPLGPGSLQVFIEHDPDYHYFNFDEQDKQRLRPVVLFDLLINNADRKGSHILVDQSGHLWLIDHGICFHTDDKLRTVIWDFAGEKIPPALARDLRSLEKKINDGGKLRQELLALLDPPEVDALAARAGQLTSLPVFPDPDLHRRPYPWPPV
jgi:uncharacterized repeat protein (TIGR03843 family)